MIGWIVVGWSDGQRFGVGASSQELLRIAESSALQSMVAIYDRKHPSTLTEKTAERLQPDPAVAREAPRLPQIRRRNSNPPQNSSRSQKRPTFSSLMARRSYRRARGLKSSHERAHPLTLFTSEKQSLSRAMQRHPNKT